jgi:triosephosphate isomerase (TIM)
VVISPPAPYLLLAKEHLRKDIQVAAQNVFDKPNGAFTGEISASQLQDLGITWTLTGHSERRTILREDDEVNDVLFEDTCIDSFSLLLVRQRQLLTGV